MNRQQKLTLATLALIAALAIGIGAYSLWAPDTAAVSGSAASGYADQPTLGRDDAPVKPIMIENFLCEHCKAFEEEVFPQLARDYIDTGKVEAYYINLAWGGDRARLAGLAGECAYRQDERAFWSFKSALYQAQDAWQDVGDLEALARDVADLDASELRTCVETSRYQSEVQRDLDLADRVGIQATPSLVIGDRGFQGPSYAILQRAIDEELSGN